MDGELLPEEVEEDGDSRELSIGEGREEHHRLRETFLSGLARECVFLLNTDAAHLAEHDPLLTLEHAFWVSYVLFFFNETLILHVGCVD